MRNEKENPAALAGAHRAENIKAVSEAFDGQNPTVDAAHWQAAYVAARYHLSPCLARLVCNLAQIGGRLA